MAHRSFKHWFENNNHADAQITGVERTILWDWVGRLHILYEQWASTANDQRAGSEVVLLRLLLGERKMDLDRIIESTRALLVAFREQLADAFRATIASEMGITGEVLDQEKVD